MPATLNPDFRLTAVGLSAVINGVATILLFVFIDPYLSVLTDDVMDGRTSEPSFRRAVVWLAGSRILGTLMAQLMLVPGRGADRVDCFGDLAAGRAGKPDGCSTSRHNDNR